MPEGPEVKTMATYLKRYVGTNITSVKAYHEKYYDTEYAKVPAKIVTVEAYGKKLIILTDAKYGIFIELGMTGIITVKPELYDVNSKKVKFIVENEDPFYFFDTRMFGKVSILSVKEINKKITNLGIDMMDIAATTTSTLKEEAEYMTDSVYIHCGSTMNICNFLLKDKVICGVGNYIKSEALYLASISPHRKMKELSRTELRSLLHAILNVMSESYKNGGLSIRDYFTPDGTPGGYVSYIYKKKYITYNGIYYNIVKEEIGGRVTYWCPDLQH